MYNLLLYEGTRKLPEILNQTKDIFLVANLLGHSNLNTTKIYLHKDRAYTEYMRKNLDTKNI
jgi:site-specific recombinase XerD